MTIDEELYVESFNKGLFQGHFEGREEGKQLGYEKGFHEGIEKILKALDLLKQNIEFNEIVTRTGLRASVIERLSRRLMMVT